MVWAIGGCASGPTELLDEMGLQGGDCSGQQECFQRGQEATGQGRFDEGRNFYARACGDGHVEACRELAHGLALGWAAAPDAAEGAKLLRWACDEADHGSSCHDLGELQRRGLVERDDAGALAFQRACSLGSQAGCHDRALLMALEGSEDPQILREAARSFAESCEAGLAVGCMNLAHLVAVAAQGGPGVDEAADYFGRACQDDPPAPHPLANLSEPQEEPDLFAVAEFHPRQACEQLQALATGLFEQRIIAAFQAEEEALRECFEEGAREQGQTRTLTFEVDLSSDGYGKNIREISQDLDHSGVRECAQALFARHLDDGAQAGSAMFQASWVVSYVGLPAGMVDDDGPVGCDADEVRQAVADQSDALRRCTRRYVERNPDQPGAALVAWEFEPSGEVARLVFRSSVNDQELTQCLIDGVREMAISSFDSGTCPLRLPFSFAGGRNLHFPIFGR